MTKLIFHGLTEYEDGMMARVETTGDYKIPFNVYIDNSAELEDIHEGLCSINICGVGSGFQVFATEDEYEASDNKMALISMIPVGTFPLEGDDEQFEPSPHILFTGKVQNVEWNDIAGPDEPNCCVLIETLGLELELYMKYDEKIERGCIIHGVAWLFGDMHFDA